MSADRNASFDCAKGIGIILVVYGHVARGLLNAGLPVDKEFHVLADSAIYSFHMPLFFFISGSFAIGSLARRGWRGLVLSKLDTIFYPYIVWSLLQGLLEVSLSGATNGSVTLGQVFSLLWQPRAHFWFLYELFSVFVIAGLLYRCTNRFWLSTVFVASIALYLSGFSPVDIYAFNTLGQWFVYFALGVITANRVPRLGIKNGYALAFFTAAFLVGQWVFHDALGYLDNSHSTMAGLLLALFGIAFVMAISQHVVGFNWSWLQTVGRRSMEIYLVHVIAGSGIRIILHRFLGVTDIGIHMVLGMVGAVVLPLLLATFCERLGIEWIFRPPRFLCFDRLNRGGIVQA